MRVNTRKIIQRLEALYPPKIAETWDNVGLQIGNENHVVERILLCLEVTDTVIDEAVRKGIDLIIAHHPLIFKPLKNLSEANPKNRMITRLIRENISLYVMHTNLDQANGGLNDMLAKRLGLSQVTRFKEVYTEKLYKLAVYVPQEALSPVSEAIYGKGAGRIGHYDSCGFENEGVGTFRPLEGATPHIGTVGEPTRTPEVKFETVVPEGCLSAVLSAMHMAHPYETPAYDLFILETPSNTYSLGRIGHLKEPLELDQFVAYVKSAFGVPHVKVANSSGKKISKVAVVSGAGMDYVGDAARAGADVFITGDIKYHEALECAHLGLMLIDVGHFESEVVYKYEVATIFEDLIAEQGYDLAVLVSEAEKPVFEVF